MSDQAGAGTEPRTGIPKRIIAIALDGSDHATAAYKYYINNLRQEGDKVYLLHSIEINSILHSLNWYNSPYSFNEQMLPTLLEQEQERTRRKLEGFAARLKDDGIDGIVKSIHAESPGHGIVKTVDEIGASLVILGTRGLGILRRTIMGSVSDYVLHHSHVPVLICRKQSDQQKKVKQ